MKEILKRYEARRRMDFARMSNSELIALILKEKNIEIAKKELLSRLPPKKKAIAFMSYFTRLSTPIRRRKQ